MRNLNLVFQGGGVKGIAYAGVLQSLPEDCVVQGVGGTSAGALVAALVAIGKRGEQLNAILRDPKLYKLIDEEEAFRYQRIKSTLLFARSEACQNLNKELKSIWHDYNNPGLFGWKKAKLPGRLKALKNTHADVFSGIATLLEDLADCWRKKGLHSSLRLRRWLNEVLEYKKFGDLKKVDLRIMAADVSKRSYQIFETQKYEGIDIAHAVHASVSIPIFFEPLVAGTECYVDGGMLSNYPHFLFAQSPYPTVGLELVENTPKGECQTTTGFLSSILATMVESHDKHRRRPQYFKSYAISTPKGIAFDKFDLNEKDVHDLYLEGVTVGQKINWTDDEHSSEKELVVYYDPKSDEVLDNALQQAGELIKAHIDPQNWVETINQKVYFRLKVDEAWNARYDRRDEIKVDGPRPLVLQRIILKVPREVGKFQSLVDTNPSCVDDTNGDQKKLVHIPAFNGETEKGFIVFYNPPIGKGEEVPRKIQTSVGMLKEFVGVEHGENGNVSLSMTRRATNHILEIKIEIWIHRSLPTMEFEPNFPEAKYETSIQTLTGRKYEVHSWSIPTKRHEVITFPLAIKFRAVKA